MNRLTLMAMVAVLCTTAAQADERWHGALMGSAVLRDGDLPLDLGAGAQALAGYSLSPQWKLEGGLYATRNRVDGAPGHVRAVGGGVDALYLPGGEDRPFWLAGAGLQRDDFAAISGGDKSAPYVNLGVGFTLPSWNREGWKLREELRLYALQYDNFPGADIALDLRFNIGLQFGGSSASPVVVIPKPEPTLEVASMPEPLPIVPAPMVPPPLLPMEFDRVYFDSRSSTLSVPTMRALNTAVKVLEAYPGVQVEIGGHADDSAAAKTNEPLSQARAEAVRDYLMAQGIAEDRLSLKRYGARQPRVSNQTPEGRTKNRRVEIRPLTTQTP